MSRTPKNPYPRIHEVKNANKPAPAINTNYDQRLWPPPGKYDEKNRQKSFNKTGKN